MCCIHNSKLLFCPHLHSIEFHSFEWENSTFNKLPSTQLPSYSGLHVSENDASPEVLPQNTYAFSPGKQKRGLLNLNRGERDEQWSKHGWDKLVITGCFYSAVAVLTCSSANPYSCLFVREYYHNALDSDDFGNYLFHLHLLFNRTVELQDRGKFVAECGIE